MYAELTRKCSVCEKEKADNGKNWYRHSTCAACYMKKYKKDHPERVRDSKLKHCYGISLEVFDSMLKAQKFKCAICQSKDNKLKSGKVQNFVVDHCHSTGKVRGLLCHTCNMRVGIMENWGKQVTEYLKR